MASRRPSVGVRVKEKERNESHRRNMRGGNEQVEAVIMGKQITLRF